MTPTLEPRTFKSGVKSLGVEPSVEGLGFVRAPASRNSEVVVRSGQPSSEEDCEKVQKKLGCFFK